MSAGLSGAVPPPYALAIVICDAIWRDPGTGKRLIIGCFSVLNAHEFPATQPMMAVYVSLTNGRGQVPLRIQLVDADEEREPIFSAEMDTEFTDPRMIAEVDCIMMGVTFPQPGEYRMQVFASGQFVIERRIVVQQIPKP